ncbi:DUF6443 domain-containing protein, partial [Flavobacterium sp. NRK F10]|uniref:DUF6443 domain-containing protein n=1 Tax=Flavobacterium sp. NRK F10 TaxID=2954931 RepID=UPI0020908238
MRKKLLFFLSLVPVLALGQSPDQNYVKTTTYKQPNTTSLSNPGADEAVVQITYYDGLGRPVQQIAHKQSNGGNDIVTPVEYDAFGRQTKEFLPYANSAPSLNYIDATTVSSDLNSFYSSYNGGTTTPFSEKELEASPLDRIKKQAAPGDAWAMNSGKEIRFDYQSNDANEVKLFQATASWDATLEIYSIALVQQMAYNAQELYKTVTKDENWTSGKNHTTEEFKNKEGQVVLKRTYADYGAQTEVKHDTYYVYDQFGNLTYVLPPLAAASDITQDILDELCYQYRYDKRNRLVEKKLPGKQWEYIVYNSQDQVVASGPAYNPWGATGENDKGWLITKYDVFGRVLYTGYYTGRAVKAVERTAYQAEQDLVAEFFERIDDTFTYDNVTLGYTNKVLPTSGFKLLSLNYYDNYDYPFAPATVPTTLPDSTYPIAQHVKGFPTGSWVRVLDDPTATTATVSYTLYDDKYRPVRTYTTNHLGGYTQVDTKLDWAGQVDYTLTTHQYDANAAVVTVKDMYTYTDQGRLLLHKQQIDQTAEQLISKNTYDELGQLISKNVGGTDVTGATALQTVDYTYNIRGWLTNINDVNNIMTGNDLFNFKIDYNDYASLAIHDAAPDALYNGNISATYWRTANDNVLRKYNY